MADFDYTQGVKLLHHLPPGEIDDDEPLLISWDGELNLMVIVPRTGVFYTLREGLAWKAEPKDGTVGTVEITVFQHGEPAQRDTIRMEAIDGD